MQYVHDFKGFKNKKGKPVRQRQEDCNFKPNLGNLMT